MKSACLSRPYFEYLVFHILYETALAKNKFFTSAFLAVPPLVIHNITNTRRRSYTERLKTSFLICNRCQYFMEKVVTVKKKKNNIFILFWIYYFYKNDGRFVWRREWRRKKKTKNGKIRGRKKNEPRKYFENVKRKFERVLIYIWIYTATEWWKFTSIRWNEEGERENENKSNRKILKERKCNKKIWLFEWRKGMRVGKNLPWVNYYSGCFAICLKILPLLMYCDAK